MDRRDAVKRVAILMGGALSVSTMAVMLEECKREQQYGAGPAFTADENNMISAMCEIIIPRTHTPGAKDAGVPAFVVMMMQECYPDRDQADFHAGLKSFNDLCLHSYGNSFLDLTPDKQVAAVKELDSRVLAKKPGQDGRFSGKQPNSTPADPLDFYRHLKELTLLGYFTSKPGATEALRYVQIPGRYDGCVPYHPGDKAWAT
ncbi:MAG TPA: gluconate 2-dehydrogenase subunit 3 family protein [Chitinophagaceae bacterium]|nr:gluconate 2-dehydrogenase subunit 3 family protein [Chitinophagaceae bacterium]